MQPDNKDALEYHYIKLVAYYAEAKQVCLKEGLTEWAETYEKDIERIGELLKELRDRK